VRASTIRPAGLVERDLERGRVVFGVEVLHLNHQVIKGLASRVIDVDREGWRAFARRTRGAHVVAHREDTAGRALWALARTRRDMGICLVLTRLQRRRLRLGARRGESLGDDLVLRADLDVASMGSGWLARFVRGASALCRGKGQEVHPSPASRPRRH